MTNTRELQKQATRERLLAAAQVVLRREGLARATTRAVAVQAGVAHGTLFLHFRDLPTLVAAVLDLTVGPAVEAAVATAPKGAILPALLHVCGGLYAAYDRDPELARAAIAGSLFHVEHAGVGDQRLADFSVWVVGEVMAAVERGEIEPIDPVLAFSAFFSLYFGFLVAGLRGQVGPEDRLRLLEASLEHLFRPRPLSQVSP